MVFVFWFFEMSSGRLATVHRFLSVFVLLAIYPITVRIANIRRKGYAWYEITPDFVLRENTLFYSFHFRAFNALNASDALKASEKTALLCFFANLRDDFIVFNIYFNCFHLFVGYFWTTALSWSVATCNSRRRGARTSHWCHSPWNHRSRRNRWSSATSLRQDGSGDGPPSKWKSNHGSHAFLPPLPWKRAGFPRCSPWSWLLVCREISRHCTPHAGKSPNDGHWRTRRCSSSFRPYRYSCSTGPELHTRVRPGFGLLPRIVSRQVPTVLVSCCDEK